MACLKLNPVSSTNFFTSSEVPDFSRAFFLQSCLCSFSLSPDVGYFTLPFSTHAQPDAILSLLVISLMASISYLVFIDDHMAACIWWVVHGSSPGCSFALSSAASLLVEFSLNEYFPVPLSSEYASTWYPKALAIQRSMVPTSVMSISGNASGCFLTNS